MPQQKPILTEMTVSVIITTFNRPDSLKRAVESVLNQNLPPEEIIVINDGDTWATDESYLRHSLVKVYQNEKSRGANFSRNRGADLAIADVLMFLDDDDTWEIDKIHRQIQAFGTNSEAGLVYSGRIMVYDTDRTKELYKVPANISGYIYPDILERNIIGTTSSVAIKKAVFFEAGGFDEDLPAMQDYDLWMRICRLVPVVGDGGFNVRYTLNKNSKKEQISNSGTNQEIAVEMLLSKYEPFFKMEGISLRKRKARWYFYIAKSLRKKNFRKSFSYALKSFLTFPNLPAIAIVFFHERKRLY